MTDTAPTLATIRAAHERIKPHIHRTPVLSSRILNEKLGGELYFKCENFQKVAAFKARGATNAVFTLMDDMAKRGVVTHSSGNHGAALAWAAGKRGVKAHIVMPNNAPRAKKMAVESYGGRILFCEPTLEAREEGVNRLIREHGLELVHPYNDYRVIAGQGTAALELLEEVPDLDIVITPLGGGGLLSGTALASKGVKPGIRVIGAEPAAADDGYRGFKQGKLIENGGSATICDGLRSMLGDKSFAIVRGNVDDIVLSSEENVVRAMRSIWELLKIVVEPSACPPLGAIMEGNLDVKGKKVGVVLTGGNVDLDKLPWQH